MDIKNFTLGLIIAVVVQFYAMIFIDFGLEGDRSFGWLMLIVVEAVIAALIVTEYKPFDKEE